MSRRKSLPSWSLRSGGETDDGHVHSHEMSAVTALKKLERERERVWVVVPEMAGSARPLQRL